MLVISEKCYELSLSKQKNGTKSRRWFCLRKQKAKHEAMNEPTNPKLTAAILEAVNNQLVENEPPETRTTYQRLIQQGYNDEAAKKLIGAALSVEIYGMLKEKTAYDQARYLQNLAHLPQMPWEENEA